MGPARRPALRGEWLAPALLLLAAPCGGEASPDPRGPRGSAQADDAAPAAPAPAEDQGVVLRVEDQPIRASEVDRLAAMVGELYPQYTRAHRRRLALTNVLLPRAAAAAARPEERARARAAVRAAQTELDAFDDDPGWAERLGGLAHRVEGPWDVVGGFDLWGHARALAPETWSEPLERVGSFDLVRLRSRQEAADPAAEVLELDVVRFPYLPPGTTAADVDALLDGARLEIVDPAWRELVPEALQYRMRGADR